MDIVLIGFMTDSYDDSVYQLSEKMCEKLVYMDDSHTLKICVESEKDLEEAFKQFDEDYYVRVFNHQNG